MGFGHPASLGSGQFFNNLVGKPSPVLSPSDELSQANIPLLSAGLPPFRFGQASLIYFQFVFAAITPLLFLGSVLTRMNLKALDDLRRSFGRSIVYPINAFLLWGGGYFAMNGAVDYSGGYVIHLAAGVTGVRRRMGRRSTHQGRPRGGPEQHDDGRPRRRVPVARLERLQRW